MNRTHGLRARLRLLWHRGAEKRMNEELIGMAEFRESEQVLGEIGARRTDELAAAKAQIAAMRETLRGLSRATGVGLPGSSRVTDSSDGADCRIPRTFLMTGVQIGVTAI